MRGKIVICWAQVPKAENCATLCPLRIFRKIPQHAISITASEENVNKLMWTSGGPGATTYAQTDVNYEFLAELSAGLIDD